jgi:flagellum-specific ATP synthase
MKQLVTAMREAEFVRRTGTVSQFSGILVESIGPDAFVSELCEIKERANSAGVQAEVIALKDGRVLLMPYQDLRGISLGAEIIATGRRARVPVAEAMLGRVVDAFGSPLDGKVAIQPTAYQPLYAEPLNPLARSRIDSILETGVRAIDSLLTVGRGQRMGIFSGSGVGKSSLLGMVARNTNADVNVVALVGERGREVRDFVEDVLGEEGLRRSVVVAATSDQPALVRRRAAFSATAIAEFFRSKGQHVVLTMDSLTRLAMAQREVGLAIGEPPTARGFTPSVFALLPKLLERGGNADNGGSITAFYTVLVEGDDINDPIADSVRAILDGHIILDRELANRGRYPAIDPLNSVSRLIRDLATPGEIELVRRAVKLMSVHRASKDLVEVGAYRPGTNADLDTALRLMPLLEEFLGQNVHTAVRRSEAMHQLQALLAQKSAR